MVSSQIPSTHVSRLKHVFSKLKLISGLMLLESRSIVIAILIHFLFFSLLIVLFPVFFNWFSMQKNLKYKWLFNSTIDNLIELPTYTNDPDLHYSMQHEQHQPQHIDALSSYKTKNNYNSIELQPRSNQFAYSKKYQHQGQQQINYPNSVIQSYDNSPYATNANHHHSNSNNNNNNNQGAYLYKVENFTSFGTISCSAENPYGSSGPCLYHVMVAGEFFVLFSFLKMWWLSKHRW